MSRRLVRVRPSHACDQQVGGGTEHVVMSHLAPLLGLDPLRTEAVMPAPFLEHGPQADDVEERLLTHHPPNRRAVIRVEVAKETYAHSPGQGDGRVDFVA